MHAPAHKGTGQKYTVDGKLLGEVAEVAGTSVRMIQDTSVPTLGWGPRGLEKRKRNKHINSWRRLSTDKD